MEINSLYSDKIQTKTESYIPVLKNGRTIESKYNPEREAENLLNTIEKPYNFYVVFEIGSGIFISKLTEKFPDAFILGIENTKDDLDFLQSFENVKELSKNKNVHLSTIAELKCDLIKFYLPALYGDLKIIELLPWVNENKPYMEFIKNELNQALKTVSADFSVQAHFGKLWQKNILNNLSFCSNCNKSIPVTTSKKTAAIIAAGPTLDSKIEYLKDNRDKLFIISTDTAYQTLIKNQIYPEIVVSLDGQFVSHEHFMDKNHSDETIFAFDLCSNNSSLRKLKDNSYFFFNSGHPLTAFASSTGNAAFPSLYSGAGTVTITAFDLAHYLGFSDIQVIAADFSYKNGKSYAKGTYLDSIYMKNNNRLESSEKLFSKLMYRTELIEVDENTKTTQVLESYRTSFEQYLTEKGFTFSKENDIYYTSIKQCKQNNLISNRFNMQTFIKNIEEEYKNKNYIFLLPYISYLRIKNPDTDFANLVKLAYSELVRYNYFI